MELRKSHSYRRISDFLPRLPIKSHGAYQSPRSPMNAGEKLHAKSLQRSPGASPIHDIESKIFPDWLRQREDFQSQYLSCVSFDLIDKYMICTKAPSNRNRFEKESLMSWVRSVPDIAWMSKARHAEICEKLAPVQFEAGACLFKQNDIGDCLYLIVDGNVEVWVDGQKVTVIGKGNSIGESSIKSNSARTATCIAQTAVKALRLSKVNYDTIVLREKLQEARDVVIFFQAIPFLKHWNFSRLERLAQATLVKQIEANHMIYEKGDDSQNLYVIKSGKVALEATVKLTSVFRWPKGLREWESLEKTNEVKRRLSVCGPGDFIGEMEVGLGVPKRTDAVTLEHTVVYIILKEGLNHTFRRADYQALAALNPSRPTTTKLLQQVSVERSSSHNRLKSLLDALETNLTPKGRLPSKKSALLKELTSKRKLRLH